MTSLNVDAGTRRNRLEFSREGLLNTVGAYAADPVFEPYSSTIVSSEWGPEGTIEARRGLGRVDPNDHLKGPESHELSVSYHLERWFTSAGAAADAAYDGMFRTVDNLLPNTHLVVEREAKGLIKAENTLAGTTARGTRLYMVGTGGKVGEVTVNGDPSDSQAIVVSLSYNFERVRAYQIDQPTASTELVVYSTDPADTGVDVTIEDEGGVTAETLTTDAADGTTLVSTTSTFSDIDAIHVEGDHVGDIIVSENSGDAVTPAEGDMLAEIHGSATYDGVESDFGVPSLGAGSRADTALVGTPEKFIGDSIDSGTGPVAYELASAELSVNNNLETTERASTFAMEISEGIREVTQAVTVFGEKEGHDSLVRHLTVRAEDLVWHMDGGDLTLPSAVMTEPGSVAYEDGEAIATKDNTFEGRGLTVTEN